MHKVPDLVLHCAQPAFDGNSSGSFVFSDCYGFEQKENVSHCEGQTQMGNFTEVPVRGGDASSTAY